MTPAAVDPAFRTVSKTATAFIIWRIENLKVVPVPKDQYGTFYEGDSYIVYAASEYGKYIGPGVKCGDVGRGGRLEMHIHFWVGAESSQDEGAVAAYKSVELDELLGGTPVQHREAQGHESRRFLAYFSQGIRTLRGGVVSGLNHVSTKFEPSLFRVKGRRNPVVRQMPAVAWQHMNRGDVFLIDTKDVVFVWIGRAANTMEKLQATRVAQQLRDEHGAVSIVFVDDGREGELPEAERTLLGLCLDLGAGARRQLRDAAPDDDATAERTERSTLKLYQCSDQDGTYKVVEVKTGPLLQQDLNTNDSFIVDNGASGIWVWIGRHASPKERVEAMRNAHGFVSKKNYPASTHISRVVEGGEPTEFRALFLNWTLKDTTVNINNNYKTGKPKSVAVLDAATLHQSPRLAASTQLVDDGSGQVTVWRVHQSELQVVPPSAHGTFYAGDCYLVKYSYHARGRLNHILYYWLGLHSSVTEQTALALHTIAQDDALDGAAVQARVVQSKEPPHFLTIFHGKMVVMSGDYRPSFPDKMLIQVRGTQSYNTQATQVVLRASSLNSNDVFVLRNANSCYVWCGKGSTGDEREMAKKLANSFTNSEFTVVYEGQEKSEFWSAIGGQESYANDKRLAVAENTLPARLFHCSNATGSFKVEEVLNFTQVDLEPEDVMLLDTWDTVFLWIGNQANREERKQANTLAFHYLRTDPSGRDSDTPIVQIKQNYEPPNFTGYFGVWDPELWKDHKSYEEIRQEMESQKPVLQVELKITNGVNDFDECEKFPLQVLKEKDVEKLPLNVDATHKELHLSHKDFLSVFNMSYEDFSNLPKWRQDNLKKKVQLF